MVRRCVLRTAIGHNAVPTGLQGAAGREAVRGGLERCYGRFWQSSSNTALARASHAFQTAARPAPPAPPD